MPQRTAVVAVGGNSLIADKDRREIRYQWDAVRETCGHIACMVRDGWHVVVTHGNGPQVGFIMRRAELAAHEVHTVPLDLIVADTQGSIGYMIQQALRNSLRMMGISQNVITIATQTLVAASDPAFKKPSKPIGGFLDEEQAANYRAEGWQVVDDAGRGLRRLVASPKPLEIIELDAIRWALQHDYVVVACGGGGIPVVRNRKGELRGVNAVIDKDRASSLLAMGLSADLFLISTSVEKVAINFKTPQETWLDRVTLLEAQEYLEQGQFAEGSMGPKVESIVQFLMRGGPAAVITNPEHIDAALREESGTWFVPV